MRCEGMRARRGFSLLELMIAAAVLAFCFLHIVNHSRATVKETEVSQEDLIARHFLIDMVERYKGSPLIELSNLSPIEVPMPLGQEPDFVRKDDILSDRGRVVKEMEEKAGQTGVVDRSVEGLKKIVDIANMMQLTRSAVFQKNFQGTAGVHLLTCIVRWSSKVGRGERRIEYSKVLVRS